MEPISDYQALVQTQARLLREGRGLANGGYAPCKRSPIPDDAPKALIFSPHPDDECIIAGLALRLLKQAAFNVMNVAVTQGSNRSRQAARMEELVAACHYLGFGLIAMGERGLEGVHCQRRQADPESWEQDVQAIVGVLRSQSPKVIFFPHAKDWNSTHIGVHWLLMDALKHWEQRDQVVVVLTEYWGAMADPNLMVASSEDDVIEMVTGTSFHVGEVTRNPFHLLQPAWMMDNLRRGSELVGGQGMSAPDMSYATLYRVCRWQDEGLSPLWAGGQMLDLTDNPLSLLRLE
jgi:LmbE family N-acetylglucosaminyl deacetylase